jgi:mRNA interferase MazF
MKEGDLALALLPQRDGVAKVRPVLLLKKIPPFEDTLVCGVSSQLDQLAPELDELITPNEPDYRTSGLKVPSLIRVGFLAVLPSTVLRGRIGSVSQARHRRLMERLSNFLRPSAKQG